MQSHQVQVSLRQTLPALSTPLPVLSGALKSGDRVSLVGFGSFSVEPPRCTGRNPQTGAAIKIAAKNVVKFKAGAGLTVDWSC